MTNAASYAELSHIGEGNHIPNEVVRCARKYIAALYGYTSDSLNDVRGRMAGKKVTGKKLPPTDNTLSQHLLRCVLQLMIWRQANVPMQVVLDPSKYGYQKGNHMGYQPVMMTQEPRSARVAE